ncbi:hypothetical protein LINPERPRIM_LOCUS5335, partial [Linum perenne]
TTTSTIPNPSSGFSKSTFTTLETFTTSVSTTIKMSTPNSLLPITRTTPYRPGSPTAAVRTRNSTTSTMKVAQFDVVVKCEIWMFSRARNLMDDQLLGFALVPVSQVIGKGKVSQDYSLSFTDLFDSPIETVKLTLCLMPSSSPPSSIVNSSISSEVLLLDRKISEVVPVEYSRV